MAKNEWPWSGTKKQKCPDFQLSDVIRVTDIRLHSAYGLVRVLENFPVLLPQRLDTGPKSQMVPLRETEKYRTDFRAYQVGTLPGTEKWVVGA